MNYCKDCRHFCDLGQQITVCTHPDAPRDPVYGNFSGSCGLLRSANCLVTPRCGTAGNWFDPKLTEGTEEA